MLIRWGSIIRKCATCGKETSMTYKGNNEPVCKDCLNKRREACRGGRF